MLIALVLFALIGVAGFTLLDGVLRTQGATETRLARLSELQRAMLVVSTDLEQATGSLSGSGATLALQKTDLSGAVVNVRYDVVGGRLVRTLSGADGERTQVLLEAVGSARWSFHRRAGGWLETWPAAAAGAPVIAGPVIGAAPPSSTEGVTAVALDLVLAGLDGRPGATLRRVISVPLQPDPTPTPAA